MIVIKRDGTEVKFDFNKIETACRKSGFTNKGLIMMLLPEFETKSSMTVEEIQEVVVNHIEKFDKIAANAYQLYRSTRTYQRNKQENEIFRDIFSAKKNDITNENGNMNSETPSGMWSKAGFEVAKQYAIREMLPEKFALLHENKDIHIHDLDGYPTKGQVCIQSDLHKILREGFETVNGGIRPPKRLSTAVRAVAMSIQTSQNEMLGKICRG